MSSRVRVDSGLHISDSRCRKKSMDGNASSDYVKSSDSSDRSVIMFINDWIGTITEKGASSDINHGVLPWKRRTMPKYVFVWPNSFFP